MKKRIFQLMVLVAAIVITRCGEDQKPKTVPVVTTTAPTAVTTNSATVGGEITHNGNVVVTASGIVYSKIVSVPTLADDKIELTDTEGTFTTLLEGLNSGTTYHVRAYATNAIGTGYGEVVDFTTGNAAPVAMAVSATGAAEVNKMLTGTYTYSDPEGDVESGSSFKWYVANDASGTGEAAIAGATAITYTIQAAEQGKFIRFGVTPKAAAGNTTGVEVKSGFVGAIGEATTVTFTYNGQSVTYGILTSAATGKKWLDRNLGALNTATAHNDYANYGDLFQWGRGADGHQLIARTGASDANMSGVNGTTSATAPSEYSSTDSPGHNKFIIANSQAAPFDWRNPQNNNLWQGGNGTNNPCPTGWRIPTQAEWTAEGISNFTDGYSKLKLTLTGRRFGGDGTFLASTTAAAYWSSTVSNDAGGSPVNSIRISLSSTAYSELSSIRSTAFACRCIKN